MEKALEVKYQKMVELLGDQSTFYVDEVKKIFPEMKKSSLYWNMSKLVEGGYLRRIRNGVYAFNEWKGKKNISLLGSAEKIRDILDETGFDYYISGLDILHKYMQHVPEQYPNIVFVRKESKTEITEVLNENDYKVIEPVNLKDIYENNVYAGIEESAVLLYQTKNFDDSENVLATIE